MSCTSIVRGPTRRVKQLCPLKLSGYNAAKRIMSFDAQLQRIVDAAVAELRSLAQDDRNRARKDGVDEGRAEARDNGREQARGEARQETDRLLTAIRALDRARSLTEILESLAESAGREAPRAAVLLLRENRFHGWRVTGFGGGSDGHKPSLVVPMDEGGVMATAVRMSSVSTESSGPKFAQLPAGRTAVAAPISVAGEIVAVLYVDQGTNPSSTTNPQSPIPNPVIELLTRHASRCLEALIAIKAARTLVVRPQPASETLQTTGTSADDEDERDGNASLLHTR